MLYLKSKTARHRGGTISYLDAPSVDLKANTAWLLAILRLKLSDHSKDVPPR